MQLFGDVALAVVVDIVVYVLDASSCVFRERESLWRAVEFPMHNLYATEVTYPVLVILTSTVLFVPVLQSLSGTAVWL